jgi:hypothetical protein
MSPFRQVGTRPGIHLRAKVGREPGGAPFDSGCRDLPSNAGVRRGDSPWNHRGSLQPGYLLTSLTVLAIALGCEPDVINGWPRGHAILQGSVLRRGGVPYDGELFVTCDGHGALFRTSAPGQYRKELAWSFPEGIPADSIECQVRIHPSFAATRRVLFVPLNVTPAPLTLDVIEP